MVKYLSGRVKRTPQDQLKEDRFRYLNLEQAEPNLADPPTSNVPTGQQFQLIAIPGHPGKRYWVPTGGGLIPGAITIFDENVQVSAADSITQVNFEGKAVTAEVSVQSPSGHPGFAATVTVIPVTVGDNPPNTPTPRNGELWWESDTGDLYVYYEDVNSSQWVQANAGGRGDDGDKGDKGDPSTVQGPQGIQGVEGEKGAPGNVLAKGVKGEPGTSIKGEPGASIKGEPGASVKGEPGNDIKGDKGDQGDQGDKAGILFKFSNATSMVDPNPGNFRFNSTSLSSVSAIAIDALDNNSNDFSDFLTTWDDSTNTVKGTLEIKSNLNTDTTHAVLQITSITDNVGWLQIGVQNPVGNIPSNLEVCVLNFSRAGDKGQKGEVNVAAAGANTQVQFNDNGSFAGANNLQFIKSNTTPELILKPSDTSTNTNGGSLTVQNANNSNHSQLTSDGALELKRTNETVTTGGPYIDFKNAGTDNDARIEMDIASGQQNDADYSSIAFKTGGSGSISEKFRIGKAGQIGLSGANYGNANQVLTSKGSNSAVEWTTQLNDNTTYTLPDTGTDGTNFTNARGSATITLTGSDSTTDSVVITAGDNIKITDTGSGGFTINAQNTEGVNTTYTLPAGGTDSTDFGNGNATITLTGTDSTTDPVTITAGTNVKITGTSATGFTISAKDTNTQIPDTKYDLNVETHTTGSGAGSGNDRIITLAGATASGNTDDKVRLIAGTGITLGSDNTNKTITITNNDTGSGANTDTKYDLLVPSGTTKIRLDGATASGNNDDDIEIVGSGTVSVTRTNSNKLTITGTDTNVNTTYLLKAQQTSGNNTNPNLFLDASSGTDDSVQLVGSGSVTVTRNNDGQITISGTDTNTDTDNYANSLTFSGGTLTIGRTGTLSDLTVSIPLSGITGNFTDLDDTPGNYTNQAHKYVRVNKPDAGNNNGNGLEFVTAASVGGDISYDDLQDLPTLFSGDYGDLSNKPSLFSGDYGDLSNKPTIPTNTNQLTNGAGFLTSVPITESDDSSYRQIVFTNNSSSVMKCNDDGRLQVRPSDGALRVKGDITAFYSSDSRLKNNILPIANALDKVSLISGNTFKWNEKTLNEGEEVGVIAQEIESLGLPNIVTTRDNGYKAVRYEKLIPLLIEAIKELKNEIDDLKENK